MTHRWAPCEPVRFDVDEGFIECSIQCSGCGAKVPPDWPDDHMLRLVWDVPDSCPGPGFVQQSLLPGS